MRRLTISTALCLAVLSPALSGCGGTRTAPDSLEPEGGYVAAAPDSRPLVSRIVSVETHPTPGGLIVRAFGDPGRAGYWDPDLVDVTADDDDSGTITLEFRVRPPRAAASATTQGDRTIDAAAFLSTPHLRDRTRIEVRGATGSTSIRP